MCTVCLPPAPTGPFAWRGNRHSLLCPEARVMQHGPTSTSSQHFGRRCRAQAGEAQEQAAA
jgi:hypothetical protein